MGAGCSSQDRGGKPRLFAILAHGEEKRARLLRRCAECRADRIRHTLDHIRKCLAFPNKQRRWRKVCGCVTSKLPLFSRELSRPARENVQSFLRAEICPLKRGSMMPKFDGRNDHRKDNHGNRYQSPLPSAICLAHPITTEQTDEATTGKHECVSGVHLPLDGVHRRIMSLNGRQHRPQPRQDEDKRDNPKHHGDDSPNQQR